MPVQKNGREIFNDSDINNPDIDGGTADNTIIGGTTPAAGHFTTLDATSTVGGAGMTAYMAAPPAIGGTTPAAGTFTGVYAKKVNVPVSTDLAMATTDMWGQTYAITGTKTPVLPTLVVGMHGTFIALTAAVFSVDPNATPGTDLIVLAGTPLAAGSKATSDGSAFATIYCEAVVASKWVCTPRQGLFIDGG